MEKGRIVGDESNLYSDLPMLKEYLFDSAIVEDYFYYIHYENDDTWIFRRILVSKLQKEWEPGQGEYIFPNVNRVFYNEVKKCFSLQLRSVNTFVRYYPTTGIIEVVYHKALDGLDDTGNEICIDQPRELITSNNVEMDYYWIHRKGRIGLFEIVDGKVVAIADYISEGILSLKSYRIRMVKEKVSSKSGEVYFDLERNKYIVRWPYNGDLGYITEVERLFHLNKEESIILFLDKEKNRREIK